MNEKIPRLLSSLSGTLGLFLFSCSIFLFAKSDTFINLLITNGLLQLVLFTLVACIPFWRTKRMSYVDIAWPFGVALIGGQILLLGEADFFRKTVVGCVYLFIGLRMGIGALVMAKTTGVIFKTEFPRYTYRRMLLEESGSKHVDLHLLAEILAQCFANMTVLAIPGFLIANHIESSIANLEIVGIGIWVFAYIFESVADIQKLRFVAKNKQGVCDVGLWKYSRHPNYFAEWLVWTGLVIAAIPSWQALGGIENTFVWIVIGIAGTLASVMMYVTLVYLTGAKPAEYYSVRKRKEYGAYQERTSMFFPWFRKSR